MATATRTVSLTFEFLAKGASKFIAQFAGFSKVLGKFAKGLGGVAAKMAFLVGMFGPFALVVGTAVGAVYMMGKALDGLVGLFKALADAVNTVLMKFIQLVKEYEKFNIISSAAASVLGMQIKDTTTLALSLSKLGVGAEDGAKGLEEFGRAGFSANEAISAYGATAMFAHTAQTNLGRATTLVTGALRAFGIDASNSWRVVNGFNKAIVDSRMNFETLETAFGFAGAAGAAFGQTFEQTLSAIMSFRDIGLQASTAGTVFRRSIAKLTMVSSVGAKVLDKLGLSMDDVAVTANQSFGTVLNTLMEAGAGVKDFGDLVGKRFGSYVFKIAQAQKTYDEFGNAMIDMNARAAEMLKDDQSLLNIYGFQLNSFAGQLKTARAQMDVFGKQLITLLEPAITSVVFLFNLAFKKINEFIGITDEGAAAAAKNADKIKESFDFAGAADKFLQNGIDMVQDLRDAYNKLSRTIQKAMKTFMESVGNTMIGVVQYIDNGLDALIGIVAFVGKMPSYTLVGLKAFKDMFKHAFQTVIDLSSSGLKIVRDNILLAMAKIAGSDVAVRVMEANLERLGNLWNEAADRKLPDLGASKFVQDQVEMVRAIEELKQSLQTGIYPEKMASDLATMLNKMDAVIKDGLGKAKASVEEGGNALFDAAKAAAAKASKEALDNKAMEQIAAAAGGTDTVPIELYYTPVIVKDDIALEMNKFKEALNEAKKDGDFSLFDGYSAGDFSGEQLEMFKNTLNEMRDATIEYAEEEAVAGLWNTEKIELFMEAMAMDKEERIAFYDEVGEKSNDFHQAMDASMQSMVLNYKSSAQVMKDAFMGSFKTIEKGLDSTARALVKGGQSIGAVWKNVAQEIAISLIGALLKVQVQRLITNIIGRKMMEVDLVAKGTAKAHAAYQAAYAWGAAAGGPLGGSIAGGIAYTDVLSQNALIKKALSNKNAQGSSIGGVGMGNGALGSDSVLVNMKPDEIVLNSNASSLFRSAIGNQDGFGGGSGGGTTVIMNINTLDADSFEESYQSKIEPLIMGSFKNNAEFRRNAAESLDGKAN